MNYVHNSQKATNEQTKNDANYKHYSQLAKQEGNRDKDKDPRGLPRAATNY